VRYRDVPYLVPFLTQIWFFLSPVIYGITFLAPKWHYWLALNPMTGVLDGFRWAVLGRGIPHYDIFAISWGVAVALVVTGLWYFRRTERLFADVI
jgi:lipopolysaccharide transport system permease protein